MPIIIIHSSNFGKEQENNWNLFGILVSHCPPHSPLFLSHSITRNSKQSVFHRHILIWHTPSWHKRTDFQMSNWWLRCARLTCEPMHRELDFVINTYAYHRQWSVIISSRRWLAHRHSAYIGICIIPYTSAPGPAKVCPNLKTIKFRRHKIIK